MFQIFRSKLLHKPAGKLHYSHFRKLLLCFSLSFPYSLSPHWEFLYFLLTILVGQLWVYPDRLILPCLWSVEIFLTLTVVLSVLLHLLGLLASSVKPKHYKMQQQEHKYMGPVVQSIVSLTSSLRVISLTVLADSIYNILIFFAEKMWVAFALQKLLTFFQQKISAYLRITRLKF